MGGEKMIHMTKRQWSVLGGALLSLIAWLVNSYMSPVAPAPILPDVAEQKTSQILVQTNSSPSREGAFLAVSSTTNALVLHVMDGDTIEVQQDGESTPKKVRFLGVNTPESVDPRRPVQCFGKEASNFTKQLLSGKRILLKEDPLADDLDKYGRSLRNIFLDDGTDVNALLVKEGYAYEYTSFPQDKRRKLELKRLQGEAKQAKRGLWNPETCDGMK